MFSHSPHELTILLVPDSELKLDYCSGFLRIAGQSKLVVAASQDGHITILESDLTTACSRWLRHKIRALAIHPSEELLAIVHDGGRNLVVTDLAFEKVFETRTSAREEDPPDWIANGFGECYFAPSDQLWTARHLPNGNIEFEVRDTDSWQVTQSTEVVDPFGLSSVTLAAHPGNEIVVAWIAAGQDGQLVYWLFLHGGELHAVEASDLQDTTPPEFHPAGHEFLIIDDDRVLRRMTFPACNTLGLCEWPYDEIEGEPGFDQCCYLSDTTALANANEGRLFLVDLSEMKVKEELILQGHEPHPCEELYFPQLAGDKQIVADMNFFQSVGSKYMISVHRQLPDPTPNSWKSTLVRFGGDLFGSFSTGNLSQDYVESLL